MYRQGTSSRGEHITRLSRCIEIHYMRWQSAFAIVSAQISLDGNLEKVTHIAAALNQLRVISSRLEPSACRHSQVTHFKVTRVHSYSQHLFARVSIVMLVELLRGAARLAKAKHALISGNGHWVRPEVHGASLVAVGCYMMLGLTDLWF